MTADPAATYEKLKRDTASMFGYDLPDLSLTQGLQLDLVSLLRLEIDTMSGKVLAGEVVDLARLTAAHGLLKSLLPEKSLVGPAAPAAEVRFSTAHQAKLRADLERILSSDDYDRELARNPRKARADLERRIEAAIAKFGMDGEVYPPRATNKDDADDRVVDAEALKDPPKALPPPQPLTDAERRANVDALNAVPANPARPVRSEPWRPFVSEFPDVDCSAAAAHRGGASMIESAPTLSALEACRHEALQRLIAIDAQRGRRRGWIVVLRRAGPYQENAKCNRDVEARTYSVV